MSNLEGCVLNFLCLKFKFYLFMEFKGQGLVLLFKNLIDFSVSNLAEQLFIDLS